MKRVRLGGKIKAEEWGGHVRQTVRFNSSSISNIAPTARQAVQ